MKDAVNRVIGVIDENGTIIACSDLTRVGGGNDFFPIELGDSHEVFIRDGYTYKPFGIHVKPDYAVFVEGTDEPAGKYASVIAISLSGIKQYYDEKYDRNNFVKNIILDNVLPGDISLKARELHFNSDISRVVFLISVISSNDVSAYDVIQNLFPDKNKDFVFNITETDIVLVKEVKNNIDVRDLEKLARSISDTLSSEFFTKVNVGIGTPGCRRKGPGALLQGGADRPGSRKGIRHRQEHRKLRQPRYRASYLPPADHPVRNLPQGSVQEEQH